MGYICTCTIQIPADVQYLWQAAYILLDIQCDLPKGFLVRGLQNRLHRDKNVKEVWLIYRQQLDRFKPIDIIDGTMTHKIQ